MEFNAGNIDMGRGGSKILRRGSAKFFYKFISTVWHVNGRISMLLSFLVLFEPEFLGGLHV